MYVISLGPNELRNVKEAFRSWGKDPDETLKNLGKKMSGLEVVEDQDGKVITVRMNFGDEENRRKVIDALWRRALGLPGAGVDTG